MRPESSDAMEKLVYRIVALLEEEGAQVSLDEKIPDPDNLSQDRQIDVAVRRDGTYTQVECRLHSRPQDVGWVECLMGRRLSLGADSIIGVSASGFTAGAQAKAAAHGVILRDLRVLSEDEIRSWGIPVSIWLHSVVWRRIGIEYQFTKSDLENVSVTLVNDSGSINKVLPEVLNTAISLASEQRHEGTKAYHIESRFSMDGIEVSGCQVLAIRSIHEFDSVKERVQLASVLGYSGPEVDPAKAEAHVATYGERAFEVIQSPEKMHLEVDITPYSGIQDRLTYGWLIDAGQNMKSRFMPPRGIQKPSFSPGLIKVNVAEFTVNTKAWP